MRNDHKVAVSVGGPVAEAIRNLADAECRTLQNMGKQLLVEALVRRAQVRQLEAAE